MSPSYKTFKNIHLQVYWNLPMTLTLSLYKKSIMKTKFNKNLFGKQVGGPSWTVKLGRRDSTTASSSLAEQELPRFTDGLDSLISRFGTKGLSARDMVALSG